MKRSVSRHQFNRLVLSCVGLGLAVVIAFPYFVLVVTAVTPNNELFAYPPRLIPEHIRLENIVDTWLSRPLATYFINSTLIAVGSVLLALACAVPAAYANARLRLRGRRLFLPILLMTQMLPPVMLLVGFFQLFRQLGLMDTLLALVLVNAATGLAFAVWMLTDVFASVPHEIEEAAWIDGAGRLHAIWRVVFPIAAPGIATVALFVFILAWNEFAVALTVIRSAQNVPLSVGVFLFMGQYDVEWNHLFVTALFGSLPVVLLFIVAERHLTSGLRGLTR